MIDAAGLTAVREFTRATMARHGIPAAALAAAHDGEALVAEGFGTREVGTDAPVTPDTIFGVASVTKGFTALAIMQLAEAGKLAVDDPVVKWLPAYRTPNPDWTRATTLHHFLTHTAGLPPLPSRFFALARATASDPLAAQRPDWVADHAPLDNAEDLLAYIAGLDFAPLGAPGEQFSYCNEGFALLGAIIERVGDQPYADYVRANIFDPLGMTQSTFDRAALAGRDDVATLHAAREADGERAVVPAPQPTYAPLWYAAGGLNSTARELLRYLDLYRTGGVSGGVRLLSEAGIVRMLTPHTPGGGPGASYGYGLGVRPDYHGVKVVQHGGGSKGIASHVLVVPERGYAAVALTNLADVPADRLALAPVNALLGLPVETPFVEYGEAKQAPAQQERFVGIYRGGEGQQIVVAREDGQLRVRAAGQDVVARPVAEDAVLLPLPSGETYARFLLGGDDPAWAVALGSRIVPRDVA